MIQRRTVLILGAGASKPYGLPLGYELRDDVLTLSANSAYEKLYRQFGIADTEFLDFHHDLSESGSPSVDAFLEERPKWTDVGRSAIALCLLSFEYRAKHKLFPPHQPRDHWYEILWSRLKAPSWVAFKKQPVHIVTFNYDRSLEHYLCHVLCNNYSIRPETARERLSILHVHGSLGNYDGSFGDPVNDDMYKAAAGSIRVVHEANIEHSDFVQTRRLISSAELVLFIGFGYHKANMGKLGFGPKLRDRFSDPRILGTHKGIKAVVWHRLCRNYRFSPEAQTQGGGPISEFVAEWLE
ncbi:MAG: hypothetical protein NTX17_05825 [Candidatus Eisenbacteria bacterium]|nr:hypothetical protein [Candidatus Eisenbacteria bacterium]